MAEIFVGEVAVGVVPDASKFNEELRRQLFPEADNIGREYGSKLGRGIQESVRIYIEKIKADLKASALEVNVNAETAGASEHIDEMRKEQEARPVELKVNVDKSFGAQLASKFNKFSQASFIQPSAMGTALALSPSLIPLAAGIASGVGAIAVSFGAAVIGAGLFGVLAKSALTQAGTAAAAVKTAQERYNIAIAAGVKHSTAYAAEQKAIALAYKGMSPAQIQLSKQVGDLSTSWDNVKKSLTPVIAGALVPWLHAARDAMQFIKPIVTPIAAVFRDWGQSLQRYFSNTIVAEQLRQLAESFGKFSASQLRDIGSFLVNIGAGIFHLGTDLSANNVNFGTFGDHLKAWGKAFDTWSKSAKARADVQGFLHYLHTEGPVVNSLLSSLGKILPGIFSGASTVGQMELKALSQFFALIASLPKGWQAPLTEAAGALLLLSKTGTIKVGLQLAGALADHPRLLGFSIGTLLAAGIIDAVNQKRPGHGQQTWWQSFGPPDKAQQQTWLNSWSGLGDRIVQIADDVRHGVSRIWDSLWNHTLGTTKQGNHDVVVEFDKWRHNTSSIFDNVRHDISSAWDAIWRNTINQVHNGIIGVIGWFRKLPGMALGALSGFGHSLYAFAHAALTEFLDGLKAVGGTVLSWLKTFIGSIPGAIMKFLHMSPPHPGSVFYDLGANLMHHLEAGIKFTAHKAVAAAQTAARRVANVGSGVQRWAGLVKKALAMEGLSPMLLGRVLFQMQTESGGNPNAINLTDSNAAHGDPSRGLMQTIMSTFQAYHWPGTSSNIYDPLANIAAALNYARHVYGPSLMSGGMGIGSGHGYDEGGWLMPGDWGINTTTQPEPVLTPKQWDAISKAAVKGGDGGTTYVAHFDGVTAQSHEAMTRRAFQQMDIGRGRVARMGRRQ